MASDQKLSSEPPCCRHIASFRAIKANQRRVFIEKLKELLAAKKKITTDEKSSSSSDSSTSSSTVRGTLLGLGKRKRVEGGAQGGPLKKLKSVQEKVDGWLNKLKQNLEDEKQETGFTHDDSEILSLITKIQQTKPGKARRELLKQLVKGLIEHDSVADKQLTALEEKAALKLQEQRQLPDAKTFQIHESSLVLMLRHIPFDTHPDHFNQVISELKKTSGLKVMDFSHSVFSESQFPELWEQIVRQSELQRLSLHDVKLSESNLALIDPKKWEKPPLFDLESAHEEKLEKKDVRPTVLLRTALPSPGPLLTATPTVKPLRVLSMDGGGVKGLIERAILVVMLQEAKKINEKATIQSLFDIIIGTSTGGLITGGLAKFLDLDNIQDIFYWVATNIFNKKDNPVLRYPMMLVGKGWYDTGKLETLIKDKLDGENWWLGPAKAGDTGSKVVVPMGVCTTVWKWNTFATPVSVFWENFDTVTSNRSRTQVNLVQALRSTSAAPSYFDLKEINGEDYTDGGLGANNPIEQFCLQYIQTSKSPIITSDRLLHIVSLGCGHAKSEDEETSWWKFIDNWVNSLSQTEKTHKAMIKTCQDKNWEYLRLNLPPTTTLTAAGKTDLVYWGDLDLATSDVTVLADMEKAATSYAVSQTESIKLHVTKLLESATFN